jgi:FKBP-type peptidyl-prolyl cis-trans isomerase
MDPADFYTILEVPPTASSEDIEKAYERLARLYQPDPDKDPSDPAKMRQVNDAFDVLDDPNRRAEYDRSRVISAPSDVAAPHSAAGTAAEEAKPLDRKALYAVGLIALGAGAIVAAIVLAVFVVLDDDGGDSGLFQTASGLQFREIAEGVGAIPQPGDRVFVSYAGRFEDGTLFDSSEAFDFVLGSGQVIAGWDEGIGLMNVGDRTEFIIPPALAYGPDGLIDPASGQAIIPPSATLTFDVFLINFQPQGGDGPPDVTGEEITTDSGLTYIELTPGTGASPVIGDAVTVNYTGWLAEDGTQFDTGAGIQFELGFVIEGWNEGLQLMQEGGANRLIIPPDLAYGPSGQGPIPPNSILIFDVELLEVTSAAETPEPSATSTTTPDTDEEATE